LDVFDTSDPNNVNQLITAIRLPGSLVEVPSGLAIDGTAAFVADGSAGLQIVNYESLASGTAAPAIEITSQPTSVDASKPGLTLVEGQSASFSVKVSDASPVTSVQLLAVTTDPSTGAATTTVLQNNVNAPFDLNGSLPLLSLLNGSNQVSLEIQATDAAGHVSTTAPIAVTLVPDTTPPRVSAVSVRDGAIETQAMGDITVTFSKPLDPNTVNASTFSIIGPDGKPLSGVTATLERDGKSVVLSFNSAANLAAGNYQLKIDDANVADLVGNALGTGSSTTHFDVQAFSDVWINPFGGDWNDAANWSAGHVPTANDTVFADVVKGGSITISGGNQSVASLVVGGQGTLSIQAGSLNVAGSATIEGNLDLAGTLSGSGTVTVEGMTTVNGGSMTGTGTTIAQGGLTISGSGLGLGGGRILENQGIANWLAGTIELEAGGASGTLRNDAGAVFNATDGGAQIDGGTDSNGKVALFDNRGSFVTTGSGAAISVTARFTNSGSVDVNGVGLTLLGNAGLGGTVTVEADSRLSFAGTGVISITGNIAGAGSVTLDGATVSLDTGAAISATTSIANGTLTSAGQTSLGTLDLIGGTFEADGSTTIATLTASGGTLTGSGTVTVTGAATLSGAVLSGSGTTIAQSTLTIDGSGLTLMGGYVLENQGVANWTSGSIQLGGGSAGLPASDGVLRNDAGAVFNADIASQSDSLADGSIVSADGSASALFDNEGTFNQLGNVTTSISVTFNNSGGVFLNNSALTLSGGGISTGTITIDPNSVVTFDADYSVAGGALSGGGQIMVEGGTVVVEPAAQYDVTGATSIGGGTLRLDADATLGSLFESDGLLTGTGTVTVTGTTKLTGGAMTGSGRTIAQGGLTIDGNGIGLDDGRVLENQGDTEWLGGVIDLNPFDDGNPTAGIFVNDVGADFNQRFNGATILARNYGDADSGASALFDNRGSYYKGVNGPPGNTDTVIGVRQ
jgi:Bacterial Ig-like domain